MTRRADERREKTKDQLKSLAKNAEKHKKAVLDGGRYTPIPHDLIRTHLPDLKDKYDGQTARDSIMLFFYLCSYVNGESANDLYMWSFPTIEQMCEDTGIHKDRVKKLCDILQSEDLLVSKKIGWKGNTKKMYLPLLPAAERYERRN